MIVALIPARGGSKSIPLKNIKEMCGKPLIYWTIKAACDCGLIDRVYLSTDSDVIKETALGFCSDGSIAAKLSVIPRSAETSSDTASTESVMMEFADGYDFDTLVLIQATSPLLTAEELEGGLSLFAKPDTDSVLSGVRQYRFIWSDDETGCVSPVNYDVFNRPRRQDFEGFLMENGAFYITSRDDLLRTHNRISGRIRMYECAPETATELDEPIDWDIIERLLKKRLSESGESINDSFRKIRIVLTDCDGCLTDGGMYYSENGDELKKFNTRDGKAFAILREKGIKTGIITGEDRELNRRRANKLKLDYMIGPEDDKLTAIKDICKKEGFELENVMYIGDDLQDIEALRNVGVGVCPADAAAEVREVVSYITKAHGGEGVVREVVDMMSRELW